MSTEKDLGKSLVVTLDKRDSTLFKPLKNNYSVMLQRLIMCFCPEPYS